MLRVRGTVRSLGDADVPEALDLCGRDRLGSVFVAARIQEGLLDRFPGALLGYYQQGRLAAMCWSAANLVPVECDEEAVQALVPRLRRLRRQTASLFGRSEQVARLWQALEPWWSPAQHVRAHQPLLVTTTPPSQLGVVPDPRVRLARPSEVGIVLPAAAAMFTGEIGYPPYRGSDHGYRRMLAELIEQGHTYVWAQDGEVLFKADVGSAALGQAQIQGVWLAPQLRGRGLSVPLIAAVTEQVMETVSGTVSLYVNDYNRPALAAYHRVGYRQVGEFTTVLL